MSIKLILVNIASFLFCINSYGQNLEFSKIDSQLTKDFREMLSAEYEIRSDSLGPAFKSHLLNYLTNPVTFNNEFDSLSKLITIRTSPDKKIKFYSWDDLTGGTWHHITCVAQFETETGKIVVQQINSENEDFTGDFTDSKILEIHEINSDINKLYLTIAWGTYGSGSQHQIVQIFRINGDTLQKCNSCFTDNNDQVILYPRSEKATLKFDSVNITLSYKEFELDEVTGFYKATRKMITLEFIDGRFIRKQ